jgi:hypothetical protein
MLRRIVDVIERFEEGNLNAPAFAGATLLFAFGRMSYAAPWALIGWVWYMIVRIVLGYPI